MKNKNIEQAYLSILTGQIDAVEVLEGLTSFLKKVQINAENVYTGELADDLFDDEDVKIFIPSKERRQLSNGITCRFIDVSDVCGTG